MKFYYQIGEETQTVILERDGDQFRVTVGDKIYHVTDARLVEGQLTFRLEERPVRVYIAHQGSQRHLAVDGETWVLAWLARPQSKHSSSGASADALSGSLEATMPGLVVQVLINEGAEVERGQPLILLEAMKMELKISAPYAGRVRRVHCAPGQVVERGQVLVEIEMRN
jgi:biotin carboxyl carrier protein